MLGKSFQILKILRERFLFFGTYIYPWIRELEFQGRLSDFFLSPQFAIKDQVCMQLSLLCETMTYFGFYTYRQNPFFFNISTYIYYSILSLLQWQAYGLVIIKNVKYITVQQQL